MVGFFFFLNHLCGESKIYWCGSVSASAEPWHPQINSKWCICQMFGNENLKNGASEGSKPGTKVAITYPEKPSIHIMKSHKKGGMGRCKCLTQMVKNSSALRRPRFDPWVGKIPWRRKWQTTPVFLPGEFPGTEEPGGLQPMGSQRVRQDWATNHSQGLTRLEAGERLQSSRRG